MRNNPTSLSRQDTVEVNIRQWIMTGRYTLGAWLPSISQLCREFQVSDKTVKRALDRLKDEGLIRGVNGRGLLVSRRQRTVLLLTYRGSSANWSHATGEENRMRKAVESWHEKIEILGRANDNPIGADLEKHAETVRRADVVVTYSIQNDDYHLKLAALGKPVLAIDFCPQRAAINSVSFASFQAGYRAARHLIELGHRKLAFVGVVRDVTVREPEKHIVVLPENDTELAQAGFRSALLDAGMPTNEAWQRKPSNRDAESETALVELFRGQDRPTALVCWQPKGAMDAPKVLRAAGFSVPGQISVCQATGRPIPQEEGETLICYDMRQVFDLAIERLEQLIEEPEMPQRISQIVPIIRAGNTSAPLYGA